MANKRNKIKDGGRDAGASDMEMLTVSEVARLTSLSASQIRRLVHAGIIPCVRFGLLRTKLLIPRADLAGVVERAKYVPHGTAPVSTGRRPDCATAVARRHPAGGSKARDI